MAQVQSLPKYPIFTKGRPTERRLLLFISIIFALGIFILIKAQNLTTYNYLIIRFFFILVSFWGLHIFLVFKKEEGDELFLPLASFLIVMGWLQIFRIEPSLAHKQMYWIFFGEFSFVLWYGLVKDYRVLEDYKYLFLMTAIVLQIAVTIFGTEVNGAKLWFKIFGLSIQPVEIIKIFLTFFLASYLKQNRKIMEEPINIKHLSTIKYYILLFLLWGAAESVLIVQKDLGMSLLLFGVFIGLFYVSTKKWFLTFMGFILFLGGAFFLYKFFPHVKIRMDIWWNPWINPEGSGYQIIQALYSLGDGGLFGTGLGRGQPSFVPEIHTDFIFVSLAEELGLLGALLIICAFLILIHRMFMAALNSKDEFSVFLSFGLGVMFATQVFIIIGGAVKFIPLTGITLPFVSYGGSSLVSNFILLALFLQISGRIKSEKALM